MITIGSKVIIPNCTGLNPAKVRTVTDIIIEKQRCFDKVKLDGWLIVHLSDVKEYIK